MISLMNVDMLDANIMGELSKIGVSEESTCMFLFYFRVYEEEQGRQNLLEKAKNGFINNEEELYDFFCETLAHNENFIRKRDVSRLGIDIKKQIAARMLYSIEEVEKRELMKEIIKHSETNEDCLEALNMFIALPYLSLRLIIDYSNIEYMED